MNEPSKGQQIQCHGPRKPSLLEDFWTTSTFDVENSAGQSQGSMSSLSTNNHMHDPHVFFCGIKLGNIGKGTPKFQEPKLEWNVTYESLLGSNKTFCQPIPLSISSQPI
uniref:Uncharacterized protein n=1 Tax=Cucumis melo TaxID=3656 RepID=A0A9I9EJW0_CUCME